MPAMHRPRLRFNACRSALHAVALPRTQLFVVVRRSSVVCFFCRRRLLPTALINRAAFSASRSSTSSDYQETQFRETQLSTPRQKTQFLSSRSTCTQQTIMSNGYFVNDAMRPENSVIRVLLPGYLHNLLNNLPY